MSGLAYYGTWEERAQAAAKPQEVRITKARRALARLGDFELEAVAQAAIDLLNERRDPDEDHCLAGDDGCGMFAGGEHRGLHWGSEWEGEADLAPAPTYGDDQRDIMGRLGRAYRVD